MILPRMPRSTTKRSIVKEREHVRKLEEKTHAEKAARRLAERELRVLKRVRFDLAAQDEHVRRSLKLINYTPPQ